MQTDFNNKRFVPYTDEFRSGNQYGVYDTVKDCKLNTTLDIESARNLAIKLNENLETPTPRIYGPDVAEPVSVIIDPRRSLGTTPAGMDYYPDRLDSIYE